MGRAPTVMTPERRSECVMLAHEGASIEMIATELEVSYSTVQKVLQEEGITVARETALARVTGHDERVRIRAVDLEKAKRIVKDYESDMPLPRLLHIHEISAPTMYKILNVFDVPLRTDSAKESRKKAIDDAIAMYYQGERLYKITNSTGINTAQMYAEIHKRGLELRTRTGKPKYQLIRTIDHKALPTDEEIQFKLDTIMREELDAAGAGAGNITGEAVNRNGTIE